MSEPRFHCLIPAHNEAARIGAVLRAVCGHPELARVTVIDDGSTDGTAGIARAAGVELLALSPNRGKTAALAEGIAASDATHLVLIDADLIGLTGDDISALIGPVAKGRADITISLRGNAPRPWHWLGVDYISGERVIPRALIAKELAALPGLPRFGFEVFLNERIRSQSLRTAIVPWPGVASPLKSAKRGAWRGAVADLRMIGDIMRTVSPLTILRQIRYLRRGLQPRIEGLGR